MYKSHPTVPIEGKLVSKADEFATKIISNVRGTPRGNDRVILSEDIDVRLLNHRRQFVGRTIARESLMQHRAAES